MHRVVLFINPKPAAGHAQTRRGQTGNAKPVLCLVPSHGKGVEELPKNLLILSREPTQCSFSSLDIKVLKHWQYDCHTLDPLPEKPFWSLTPLSTGCPRPYKHKGWISPPGWKSTPFSIVFQKGGDIPPIQG